MSDETPSPANENETPITQTCAMVLREEFELFKWKDREFAYRNSDNSTYAIKSEKFRSVIKSTSTDLQGYSTTRNVVEAVVDTLCVWAQRGPEIPTYKRIAEHNGSIYVDIGDATGRAVEITPDGWEVLDRAPVRFIRNRKSRAFPIPEKGGSLSTLRKFVNFGVVETPEGRRNLALVLMWLVCALNPRGPYPILAIFGEQGTGKSNLARIVHRLVDPHDDELRAPPNDTRNMAVSLDNCHAYVLDNVSHIPDWFSDALCGVATGRSYNFRTHYQDREEESFNTCQPVLLNGINEAITRSDLLERTLCVNLPVINRGSRKEEKTLWKDFIAAEPYILGALFDALSCALRTKVECKELPRMADAAKWAMAAEPKLDLEKGTIQEALDANEKQAMGIALEASPLTGPLHRLVPVAIGSKIEGTHEKILNQLNAETDLNTQKQRGWPKNARSLSSALKRLSPPLRASGIHREETGHRTIRLTRIEPPATAPAPETKP